MRRPIALILLVLLVPAPGWAKRDAAEDAYQAARHGYYVLKDDARRRKFRHLWLKVIERFQGVAARHPKSARAPDALFTSAELLQDLSRISLLDEDLEDAIQTYTRLVDGFPK